MTGINKVINGVTCFLDTEILPHLSGAKRYGATVYLALMEPNAANSIKAALNTPAIKMLGISDGENVDTDKLYSAMIKSVKEDKLTVDIPLIGAFSFTKADVDKLFDCIRRQV